MVIIPQVFNTVNTLFLLENIGTNSPLAFGIMIQSCLVIVMADGKKKFFLLMILPSVAFFSILQETFFGLELIGDYS